MNRLSRLMFLKLSGCLIIEPSQHPATRAAKIKTHPVNLGPEWKWMGQGCSINKAEKMLFPKQHRLVQSMISDAHAVK